MRAYLRPANFVVAFFALLPLLVALGASETANAPDALVLAGRSAGILGLSFLLVAALISVRVPGFDVWFGGLTELWKIHHALGAASFVLVMAHPLLLAFAAARVSLPAASAVLFPEPAVWSIWAGWLSFAALAVFLAPTFWFFGWPNYQRWKMLHAVSGVAALFALAHAVRLGRSLPQNWGRGIWFTYGALAFGAFVYRKLIAPRTARARYTVVNVETVNRGVVEITLAPDKNLLRYRAGQFIYLTPIDPSLASGRNEEHPYTVSSAPGEPVLRLAIKDAGDATRALQTAAVGRKALIEGPYGDFFPVKNAGAPALWIAGGIGIAPFLSRARSLSPTEAADIQLIYCVQDESRAHFLSELEAIAAKIPAFRLWKHFFYREGPLNGAFMSACCPDFPSRDIYVCGPPPLIQAARRELRRHGIPGSRIHTEDFTWL
jgi:predicted ferric reductase